MAPRAKETYGWPEIISAVIYFGLGIGFLVIAIQNFQNPNTIKLKGNAELYTNELSMFASDTAPLIMNNWSATSANFSSSLNNFSSTSANVTYGIVTISKHIQQDGNSFSRFLQGSIDVSSSSSSSLVPITVTTERNVLSLSINLNLSSENMTVTCSGDSSFASCNGTEMCTSAYGPLAVAQADVTSDGAKNCLVPTMSDTNCITLTSRRNDTGVLVWSESFNIFGCSYPFSSSNEVLVRKSNTVDITIRADTDPWIRNAILSKGETKPLSKKVTKKDNIPTGVGILFLALLLLIGSLLMCWRLVSYFWDRHSRGEPLLPAEKEDTKISGLDDEEEMKEENPESPW